MPAGGSSDDQFTVVAQEEEIKLLRNDFNAACIKEDTAALKSLFEKSNSSFLTKHFNHGKSLLEEACLWYPVSILQCLIDDCKANIDEVATQWGGNLLHHIRYTKEHTSEALEKVKYLIEKHQLDPSQADNDGNVVFNEAIVHDNVDIVKVFVTKYNADSNFKNETTEQTLLEVAIENSSWLVASFLLEQDAVCLEFPPDREDEDSELSEREEKDFSALLRFAASQANLCVFNKLIDTTKFGNSGKNEEKLKRIINLLDDESYSTCLHAAAAAKTYLESNYSSNQTLSSTSKIDGTFPAKITEQLLAHGANIFATNMNHEIPLHIAAKADDKAVATILLRMDSEKQLCAKDSKGRTPLLSAVASNAESVEDLILNQITFAEVIKAVDCRNRNMYHIAIEHNSGLYHLLPDPGYNNSKWLTTASKHELLFHMDRDGNIPLDIAAAKDNWRVVKKILQATQKSSEALTGSEEILFAALKGKLKSCELVIAVTDGKCLAATDSEGNSALHLASYNGHLEVVDLLTIYLPPSDNNFKQTPLHLAALNGHLNVAQSLLSSSSDACKMITEKDIVELTPLHYAAMRNRVEVFEFLLKSGRVWERDFIGRNVLDVAIDNGALNVGRVIIQSSVWRQALMNNVLHFDINTLDDNQRRLLNISSDDEYAVTNHNVTDTPLRRMLRKLPELASSVFDRCLSEGCYGNVEFLDDTYSNWEPGATGKKNEQKQDDLYEKATGKIKRDATRNVCDGKLFKLNHPLLLMLEHGRVELLNHVLVKALITHKCHWPNVIYSLSVFLYLTVVLTTTIFITLSDPRVDGSWPRTQNGSDICENFEKSPYAIWLQLVIWGLLLVTALVELVQLAAWKLNYLRDLTNYLDFGCYIAIILITIDISDCSARILWQWILSAFCLLFSWINIAIQLRRLPIIGIYVVMLTKVAISFGKFLCVLLFFIVGFATAFFVLLESEAPFATHWHAMLKTAVMMLGEQDYKDTFYGGAEYQAYMKISAFGLYALFVPIMCIIVLNLLIALAVGDLSELMNHAKLERLKLSVNLALDVEHSLSCWSWLEQGLRKLGIVCKYVNISSNADITVKQKTLEHDKIIGLEMCSF
jgi:ankyrin repeat protein